MTTVWEEEVRLRTVSTPTVYYPIIGKFSQSKKRFDKALRTGNLLEPSLVSLAELNGRFVHALNLPDEHSLKTFQIAKRDRLRIVKMLSLCFTVTLLLAVFVDPAYPGLVLSAIMATTLAYFFFDYWSVFRHRERLQERAKFYGWLFLHCRFYLIGTTVFFVLSGVIQFFGGPDFLDRFGLIFDLPDGEYWRLVTGSLIHSGIPHWIGNFSVAIGVAGCCGPLQKKFFLPIFLLGGIISFFLSLMYENFIQPDIVDGLVGTSGGMAAVLGCQLVLCIRDKSSYPQDFYLAIGYFLMIGFIVAAIFIENTSLPCHVFGLLAGAVMSLFVPNYMEVTTPAEQG